MKTIVSQTHRILINTRKSVAAAESCTGGLLSSLLTDLSGSSVYFKMGIVVYSNEAKIAALKIPAKLLAEKGAVSKDTAVHMAKRIRMIAHVDFGIGITGIAGPTGGTARKPPGTVFIAVNAKNKNVCRKYLFKGSRSSIRMQSALKALQMLKKILLHAAH